MMLAKAMIINYDHCHSFIVLATVITIVDHDLKTFIVQATGPSFRYKTLDVRIRIRCSNTVLYFASVQVQNKLAHAKYFFQY